LEEGILMEPVNDVIGDFCSPCGGFKLTFDDDGKVAYAYLKKGHAIIGDVWLYNRCQTPEQSEWKDRKNLPFANCKGYMSEEGRLERPVTLDDMTVNWEYVNAEPRAYVYIFGELWALVGVGDKPGRSRFASRDGPLAKMMPHDGGQRAT
jgi:hypothetical protein